MANMDPSSKAKSSKDEPFSLDPSDPRSLRNKPSRTTSLSSKHGAKSSDIQQQLSKLQEELSSEKEEKLRAMEELSNMKKLLSSQKTTGGTRQKVEAMERDLQRVKESEGKLFESLMSQTRVLEQTKISLEEVKLENKALRESRSSEVSNRYGSGRSNQHFEGHLSGNDLHAAGDEIRKLQDELRMSTDAEEKSKMAMDGLASALKEVMMEANEAKTELETAKSKLEKATAEEESLRSSLKIMEEKYQTSSADAERFKLELEESVAVWHEKENSFITCIKTSEEEITKVKEENEKLCVSQKAAREENANLRDIVKQAVSEATIVKESLELTRRENAQFKELFAEKEEELQAYKNENESLKASEAAATQSLEELKKMQSLEELKKTQSLEELKKMQPATSTCKSSNVDTSHESSEPNTAGNNSASASPQVLEKIAKKFQHGRRHSMGEFGKLKESEYDNMQGSPDHKEQATGSISNMSEIRAASSMARATSSMARAASSMAADDDTDALSSEDYDQTEDAHLPNTGQGTNAQLKRKKTFLQRFHKIGDIVHLKGKANCKQSALPPVNS